MIAAAGSAEAACALKETLLRNIEGIGQAKSAQIARGLRESASRTQDELDRVGDLGGQIICTDDAQYPVLLKSIPDPPPVLYVLGQLEDRDLNAVAIVGSRRCSFYGREQAERFGALLAGAGITVVSGGARGVDSAAHRGALSHPLGRTLAVLGCGIDVTYPPENLEFFRQIARRGAVLSEYPLATPPLKDNFPRRNRIISGLSRGVLVVEADERSGALITARQAGEDQGRTVFALPGKVDNPLSRGPHQLIRDGAILTTGIADIIDGLGPPPQQALDVPSASPPAHAESAAENAQPGHVAAAPAQAAALVSLTPSQQTILAQLGSDALGIDRLVDLTDLPAHSVLQDLTFLTLKGMVRRVDGQNYVRRTQ